MSFNVAKVNDRRQSVLNKLNAYMGLKKLNEDQRQDFRELQEELATLQRIEKINTTEE